MFTPYPIPGSSAEGKTFLLSKGIPVDQIDTCLRNLLGGNFTPYDLEGVLTDARSAA